jgi:hypothetical protein
MTRWKTSVADILERELEPTIKEWLRPVNLVPDLTNIPPSDADRTGHLPKLYCEIISRLRLAEDVRPPSPSPLPCTDKYGVRRVTLFPCSFRSCACFRSLHSAR